MSEGENINPNNALEHSKVLKKHEKSEDYKRKIRKKFCRILEIFGSVICATVFFIIFIWYMNTDNIINCTTNCSFTNCAKVIHSNVAKIPSIVWHTNILWWLPANQRLKCLNGSKTFECDIFHQYSKPNDTKAFLFYVDNIERLPLPRTPDIIWGLLNDESPSSRLMFLEEKGLNLFNFSATFSRFSDVPSPLISLRAAEAINSPMYFVKTSTKNSLLSEYAPVMYLQSNCETSTERNEYVQKLMEYIRIDSYGACLNNKQLPLHQRYVNSIPKTTYSYRFHLFGEELLKFIAQYKFFLAIENAVCNDYITEKFWRAIEVGTVPIYYGSPLIRDWLPNNKSAILLEDFHTPELLSRHLHYLLSNDTAYEEYLEHKTLGLVSNSRIFDELQARPYQTLEGVVLKFECFVCVKLHNKDKQVNMVTKKHYDCPLPTSALTLSVNTKPYWKDSIKGAKKKLDELIEEINSPNQTERLSVSDWW